MRFILPLPPPLLNFGGAAHSTTIFKECMYDDIVSNGDVMVRGCRSSSKLNRND